MTDTHLPASPIINWREKFMIKAALSISPKLTKFSPAQIRQSANHTERRGRHTHTSGVVR